MLLKMGISGNLVMKEHCNVHLVIFLIFIKLLYYIKHIL